MEAGNGRQHNQLQSCKAACGESFSVRLLDASNTHEIKRAEVKDRSVVMQTANKDPAAMGEYTFFAKEPDKTTVTLILVRGDNLALGTTEVQVEIKGSRWGEGKNSMDLEADVGTGYP